MTWIASALATRFDTNIRLIREHLNTAIVGEWGKVCRIDSDAGDTMHASSMSVPQDDSRDATFVRVWLISPFFRHLFWLMYRQYEMLVDKYAHQPRRQPEFQLQTYYGQLQHIFSIQFPSACPDLGLDRPSNIILAAIRSCTLDIPDPLLEKIDIRFYTSNGPIHVIDVTSVQCLVGRIQDRNRWAIIDRSRSLARAYYVED
jgi:hypothetical protein